MKKLLLIPLLLLSFIVSAQNGITLQFKGPVPGVSDIDSIGYTYTGGFPGIRYLYNAKKTRQVIQSYVTTTYLNPRQFFNIGDYLHPISLIDSIPIQTGNNGKFLATNGTSLLWLTSGGSTGINGLNGTTNIGLGGNLTGNTLVDIGTNSIQFGSTTGNNTVRALITNRFTQGGISLFAQTNASQANESFLTAYSSTVLGQTIFSFGIFNAAAIQRGININDQSAGIQIQDDISSIGQLYTSDVSTNGKKYNFWLASWGAIKSRIDSAITASAIGFTPENVANKATTFGTLNNTLYPSTQAVANYVTSGPVIINQNSTPQTANFKITGAATFVKNGYTSISIDTSHIFINEGGDFLKLTSHVLFTDGLGRTGSEGPEAAFYTAPKHLSNLTTYSITYPYDTTGVVSTIISGNNPVLYSTPLLTSASTTTRSGFTINPGVAPTSPVNGNLWITASHFYAQIGGSTVQVDGGGGGLTPANPTASAGVSPVNGTLTTYMRSDAAPKVDSAAFTTRALLTTYQTKTQNIASYQAIGTYLTPSSTNVVTNKDLTSGTNTFPTFNQNTTGSAAKLTTARNINGVAFDGTANISVNLNNSLTPGFGLTPTTAFNGGAALALTVDTAVAIIGKTRYNTDYINLSGRITTNAANTALKANSLIPTALKTSAYTAVANDFVTTDASSGNVPITLTTAPVNGTLIWVKMVNTASTNTTSITAGGSDVFNIAGGVTSITLTGQNASVQLQYNSGIWYVYGQGNSLAFLDLRYASIGTTINGKGLSSNIVLGLASSDFANQGTTTTVYHGNGSGSPSFGQVVNADIASSTIDLTTKVTGLLPDANISSATNWNTAYTNRITSLTTTGSGAATLSGNVLNIPIPSGLTNPMTTTGDIIYSSSGSTLARLGIGATGNPLIVVGGLPAYSNIVLTNPASAATFTLVAGKTFTVNNTITFTGTDGQTYTLPGASQTLASLAGSETLTNKTINSPTINTPTINSVGTGNNISIATSSTSFAATSNAPYQLNGSTNILYRSGFYGNTSPTLGASNAFANVIFAGAGATTTTSGTSPMLANIAILAPTFALGTGSTTTWASTVDIEGPAITSGTGTLTNPVLSLLVRSGNSIFNGNITLGTIGNGLAIKEGTNAAMGQGTLVGGTLAVSNTRVTTNSRIFLTDEGGGVLANIGALYISARTGGTSFTVSSSNALDTSTFSWIIIEPAP